MVSIPESGRGWSLFYVFSGQSISQQWCEKRMGLVKKGMRLRNKAGGHFRSVEPLWDSLSISVNWGWIYLCHHLLELTSWILKCCTKLAITKIYLFSTCCFSSENHASKLHGFIITFTKLHFSIILLDEFERYYKKIKTIFHLLYCKKVNEEIVYISHNVLFIKRS